jgi:hydroxypyruvate reductase
MTACTSIENAKTIFAAALERVDPVQMMTRTLRLEGNGLRIETESESLTMDLADFDRIVAFGAGKASARMALGLETLLGARLHGGIVVVKTGHGERLERLRLLEASHPVPDASSVAAARALLELGQGADERTLFLGLTSGGGSALLCAPAAGLTLEDKQATTRLLLACGAPIADINAVRKHLSAVKGGQLAAALAPGMVVNLILSDVMGDDPSAIASGITAPDPVTFGEAMAILARHDLLRQVPKSVRSHLEAGVEGRCPETPKPGDPRLRQVRNVILGSNAQALLAAKAKAQALGYWTWTPDNPLIGEAREAGRNLITLGQRIRDHGDPIQAPACVIYGGETTVTLKGSGKGGRNQELALAAMTRGQDDPKRLERITLLSAGTDGNDGPTDAAGAFVSTLLLERARGSNLQPADYLARNDSYPFFEQIGGHLKTGPTNTNVCDLQILLVEA